MGKKDLASVTTDLSALASMMPTQRPIAPTPAASIIAPEATVPAAPSAHASPPSPAKRAAAAQPKSVKSEETIQFSLSLRKSLRKQLASLASDADMTMRAFVLQALKSKGLSVRDDDLVDLRKERH